MAPTQPRRRYEQVAAFLAALLIVVSATPLAVTLAGPSASPIGPAAASHGGTHIDDFEDGDIAGWSGDTGDFSVESADPITGSYSGDLHSEGQNIAVTNSFPSASPDRIAVRLRISSYAGVDGDDVNLEFRTGSNRVVGVRFSGTGNIETLGAGIADTGKDWNAGETLSIEYRNIDWTAETADLWVNGDKTADGVAFGTSTSSFDTVFLQTYDLGSSTTRSIYIDDVEYGGSNFSVESFGDGVLSDFEDGDATVETDLWEGWSGDTGSLSTTVSDTIRGDYSGSFSVSNADKSISLTSKSSWPKTPSRFAIAIEIDNRVASTTDSLTFRVKNESSDVMGIRFRDDGEVLYAASGGYGLTGYTWEEGITYHAEFRDIDYTNDTYDLYLNGVQLVDDVPFGNPADGVDEITLNSYTLDSAESRTVKFDDLELGGSGFTAPTYSAGLTDTFSDGDLALSADGWGPKWYGDTSSATVSGGDLQLTSANSAVGVYIHAEAVASPATVEFQLTISNRTNSADQVEINLYKPNGDVLLTFDFEDDGDIVYGTSNVHTGFDWNKSVRYTIEFKDFNYASDTVDVWVNGTKALDDQAFENTADGYNEFEVRSDTTNSGTTRTVNLHSVSAGTCDDCGFTPTTISTTTSPAPASEPEGQYTQPVVLDTQTDSVGVQTADMTAYYWEVTSVLEPSETDLEAGDRCLGDHAANGWVLCGWDEDADGDPDNPESSTEFNFEHRGEVTVRDEAVYLLEVRDSSTGAYYTVQGVEAEKTLADRPTVWWDNPSISGEVDPEEGDFVLIVEPGTIDFDEDGIDKDGDGEDDVYVNGGLNNNGDWRLDYYDPSGDTTQIEYVFVGPNGTEYEYNRTFDEPISNFSAVVEPYRTGDFSGYETAGFGFTQNGSRTFGTFDFSSFAGGGYDAGGSLTPTPAGGTGVVAVGGSSGGSTAAGTLTIALLIPAILYGVNRWVTSVPTWGWAVALGADAIFVLNSLLGMGGLL